MLSSENIKKTAETQSELSQALDDALIAINQAEKIVLSFHVNPDGDAIGSCLGLYFYLAKIGKTPFIISNDVIPNNLKFLDGSDSVLIYKPERDDALIMSADLLIFLDFNDITRIGKMTDAMKNSSAKKLLIDHHLFPTDIADHYLVDTTASSTSEIVWRLITRAGAKIDKSSAVALYTGILTDSGGFRYPRTDAELLRISANLVDCGADPVYINECVYNTQSFGSMKLLGKGLSSLDSFYDGRLSFMSFEKQDFLESGLSIADTEGFTNYPMSLDGVVIGIMLIDNPYVENEIKISFRSKGDCNIRILAQEYNGGGHLNASGARANNISLQDLKTELIAKCERYFK